MVIPDDMKAGAVFPTRKWGDLVILEYKGSKEVDTKFFDLKKYKDPDVRYYACVVDKNRAGAKPKVVFRLNLAYNMWEELGYLRLKSSEENE